MYEHTPALALVCRQPWRNEDALATTGRIADGDERESARALNVMLDSAQRDYLLKVIEAA